MSVTLYEMGEVSFLFFDTEGFNIKTENREFKKLRRNCNENVTLKLNFALS